MTSVITVSSPSMTSRSNTKLSVRKPTLPGTISMMPGSRTSAPGRFATRAKPLLVAMSRHLERQALALGGPAVVAASFQHARHFTPSTAHRYTTLAESAELVVALGEGIARVPAPGVSGASLDPADPIVDEWSLVVVGPHFAGAVLAKDLGDGGRDSARRFDYVVTYDRDLVVAAASALLRRVTAAR